MSTVDNRVVEMNFDNTKFASGVNGTLSMLDRLKASLHLPGASKGLQDINSAAKTFDSSQMEQGVGRIAGAFTSMQAVAFGALANVGSKISNMAINMGKEFTTAPITAGFQEYELKMGSIQTILANTARHGTKLPQVNAALEELNQYADKTIYNFGDMTKNIGLFTNAGLKVDDATSMIKGFSNEAAASGTSAEGAAGAAYQLSQALSAGEIRLMDWKSLTNVGMGNKNMQLNLIQLAEAMGTVSKAGLTGKEIQEGFNGSLEKGWLSSDVMSKYLQIQAGDMTKAEMSALGLSAAQIKAFSASQKIAEESATKVRTFSGLMGTLKEAVGSGWSETFAIVLGDFDQATELFTSISDTVGGALGEMSESRNSLLQSWANMGGRKASIQALGNLFGILGRVMTPLVGAFREIFPPTTPVGLIRMTVAIRDFLEDLTPSADTMKLLHRVFAGFFAILGIGWEVLKATAKFFFDLFAGIEEGDKGILKFLATIGDFFVGLHTAIKEGRGLTDFFDRVLKLIFKVINPIKDFGQVVGNVFAGLDFGNAGVGLGKFISDILSFGKAAESAGEGAEKGKSIIMRFIDFFRNIASNVADFIAPLADNIAGAFANIEYDKVMDALQTALLGFLGVGVKGLGGMFSNLNIFGEGVPVMNSIRDGLDNLSGSLQAMQANLKASMLLKIAAAVAALAISVVLLAGVDAAGLARATTALTVMFVQLAVAMNVFQKIGTVGTIAKLNLMGAALILIGVAILILVGAVKLLSTMSWEELGKGMSALGGIILGLIVMAKGLNKAQGAILRAAAALVIMAGAIRILVWVVRVIGEMDFETMKQGLIGVGLLLLGIAIFGKLQGSAKKTLEQAASIVLLSFALKQLAEVVQIFGTMSWETIAKGFAGIAAGLVMMAVALRLMPQGAKMLLTAFSISKVAAAFVFIAKAMGEFKDISWNTIGKGLVSIAGSLAVVTVVLNKMPKVSTMQLVSLLALSFAIREIVKSMVMIGDMDADQVAKALVVFTGVLAVIVLALNKMKGTAEGAASIAAVAASFEFLSGILSEWGKMSVEELAKGMGAFIGLLGIMTVSLNALKTEAAGAAALALVAGALSLLVPALVTLGAMPVVAIGAALVGLAGMFGILVLGLKLLQPVLPVLMGMAVAIALLGAATFLAGAGLALLAVGLTALAAAGGAGIAALVAAISAIAGLIPMVATQIGKGIVNLLTAIGNSGAALTEALVKILGALLDAIIKLVPKLGVTLLVLLRTGLNVIIKAVPMFVDAGLKIIIGLLRGIANNIGKIVDAGADIVVNFLNGLGRNLPRIIQAGIDLVIDFVNGLADGIRNNSKRMGEAGGNLASAMVTGMIDGLGAMAGKLIEAAKDLAKRAWEAAKDFLGIASPSKKFIELGKWTTEGFKQGLMSDRKGIQDTVNEMMKGMTDAVVSNRERYAAASDKYNKIDEKLQDNIKKQSDLWKKINAGRKAGRNVDALVRQEKQLSAEARTYYKWMQAQKDEMKEIEKENVKLLQTRAHVKKNLDDEVARLKKVSDQHAAINEQLDDAKEKLKAAKQARDDYNKSLSDRYGDIAAPDKDTTLTSYISNLEKQIVDTQKFTTLIQQLRQLGLNDEVYRDLLEQGPDAMPFMEELLAGGRTRIDQVNTLSNALDRSANDLGNKASKSLYQAGVDAAQGLVDGLTAKEKNLRDLMNRISDYMVNNIKTRLGIKSPSRVFAEIGEQTNQGLIDGLDRTSSAVGKSAEGVGQTAIDGMKKTISGLGSLINEDVDSQPVITPVLDLTNVRKDAASIGSLLGANPLNVDAAYSGAANAFSGYARNRAALSDADGVREGDTIIFEQHNNSPKALSAIEIYRQTNNVLSTAKGALTRNAR
jgi:tape measure domain-containing protein